MPTRHPRRDVNFAMGFRPQGKAESKNCSIEIVFKASELDEIVYGENADGGKKRPYVGLTSRDFQNVEVDREASKRGGGGLAN